MWGFYDRSHTTEELYALRRRSVTVSFTSFLQRYFDESFEDTITLPGFTSERRGWGYSDVYWLIPGLSTTGRRFTAPVPFEAFYGKEKLLQMLKHGLRVSFCCRKACNHQPDQTPFRWRQSSDVWGRWSARTQLPMEHQRHTCKSPYYSVLLGTCTCVRFTASQCVAHRQAVWDGCLFWNVPIGLLAHLNWTGSEFQCSEILASLCINY